MDLAYDHIVEESLPKEDDGKRKNSGVEQTQQSLNDEIQDAYKAFSASPWGAKIGGFFGTVVKQVCLEMRETEELDRTGRVYGQALEKRRTNAKAGTCRASLSTKRPKRSSPPSEARPSVGSQGSRAPSSAAPAACRWQAAHSPRPNSPKINNKEEKSRERGPRR